MGGEERGGSCQTGMDRPSEDRDFAGGAWGMGHQAVSSMVRDVTKVHTQGLKFPPRRAFILLLACTVHRSQRLLLAGSNWTGSYSCPAMPTA